MLIFRELQIALVEAQQRLALMDSEDNGRQFEKWVDLTERVDAYLKSLAWFPKCRYKSEIRVFLMTGCSFNRAARKCGVPVKWLYTAVWQADLVLRRRLNTVLTALRRGNIYEVEQAFAAATGDFPNAFEYVCRQHYQPIRDDEVDLRTCAEELKFLQRVYSLEDGMLGLERAKVEHLLYLLNEENHDPRTRQYLYQCLAGHWTVRDTLGMLSKYEDFKQPVPSWGEG